MAIKQISDDRDFDWEEYIIDTPEDLLAFAETKLQEMLKDEEALATV